jgi:hypothetical protein
MLTACFLILEYLDLAYGLFPYLLVPNTLSAAAASSAAAATSRRTSFAERSVSVVLCAPRRR